MAKLLRLRRGTTTQHGSFTGAEGEVTVDTDKDTLVVHDNSTAGGRPMLREDLNNMPASGVTAGTYGSSSAIPAITVDAKGRVTSATTSAIDSTSISNGTSNVSVAASGDITLTRAGTTQATVIGGGLKFGDGKRAYWGDDTDLQIWHDGSNSYIKDNGTGDIVIETRNFVVRDISGETHITATVNSSVDLYHDNSKKLNTTSTGIDVTGTVTCDGLTCTGTPVFSDTNPVINIDDSNSTGATNSTSFIRGRDQVGTVHWYVGQGSSQRDALILYSNTGTTELYAAGTKRAEVTSSGLEPGADDTYDIGTSTNKWRNAYIDGTVNCDGLTCNGSATIQASTGVLILKDVNNANSTNHQTYISGRDSGDTQRWYIGNTSDASADVQLVNAGGASVKFGTSNSLRCEVDANGHFLPLSNNAYDLGGSSFRWRNVYTNDLNLSNEGGTNDVDGTWGSWTIQEGEDDLFLLNRRNGKKYKFNLSEVN